MDRGSECASESVDAFADVSVVVEGRFEERVMSAQDVLAIGSDALVPLNQAAGETLSVYVGNVLFASAEVIVIDDHLALRITEFEWSEP
jgi:flagellar motor switch/type III secretory pathway protein FliN